MHSFLLPSETNETVRRKRRKRNSFSFNRQKKLLKRIRSKSCVKKFESEKHKEIRDHSFEFQAIISAYHFTVGKKIERRENLPFLDLTSESRTAA